MFASEEPVDARPNALAPTAPPARPGARATTGRTSLDAGFASLTDLEPRSAEPAESEERALQPEPTPLAAEDGWLLELDDAAADRGLGPVVPGTASIDGVVPLALEASYCEPEPRSRALSRAATRAAAAVTLFAGALGLFTCFLCGFIVLTVIGTYFRGPNWEFYWSPADWPAH